MTDWFTVETVDKDTFAISKYKHWEETHCYLICGTEKAILTDTGLGVDNIKSVLDRLTYFENIAVYEAENLMCKPCDFPKNFILDDYQIFKGMPQQVLHDGDCLDLGNRKLMVIHTPGHSPGHCCFYEPDRKYLFSGDLICEGCLDAFYPSTDPQLFWQLARKI